MNRSIARLKAELDKRKRRNSAYSVRAFARFLGLSPAQLSQVLSGKRPLTQKSAARISERLGLSPKERIRFLSDASRELAREIDEAKARERFLDLDEDRFRVIADWYHFAILSLTRVPGARSDSRWISKRLGISATEAGAAVQRLERLGLLETKPRFRQASDPIRVLPSNPSDAIRRYHHQNLLLAAERLESAPLNVREFQSITFAIDPSRLSAFRKRIDDFLTDASEELESESATEVYTLAVQVFPVTIGPQTQDSGDGK